jgi:hypothetical protein
MKRINPVTNKNFKSGDIREDGSIFYGYTKRVNKNGTFVELWLKPAVYHRNKLKRAKTAQTAARHEVNVQNSVTVKEMHDEFN